MMCLWNRLRTLRAKSKELSDAWDGTSKLGRGKIVAAKRQILWLWLREGSITKRVIEETTMLVQSETTGRDDRWVSWGRLCVLITETEAKELLDEGFLDTRYGLGALIASSIATLRSTTRQQASAARHALRVVLGP